MGGAEMAMQVPGIYRRRVGDLVVTAVSDGTLLLPPDSLLGIDASEVASVLRDAFLPESPVSSLNTFLVQHPSGGTVLIDTGAGTILGATAGRLLANLAAAGVQPGDITTVLLTHLHPDHSGGLLQGDAAAFPNAEIVLPEAEAAFWLDPANEARAEEARRRYFAMARAQVAPYQGRMRLVGAGPVAPGIAALPLPGHTPGHTGYVVDGGGSGLLIWGDIAHVPDVQIPRPDISVGYDLDPDGAKATRHRILDQAAADRLLVAGMHLHFPAFSHVVRDGPGYRLLPEPWQLDL